MLMILKIVMAPVLQCFDASAIKKHFATCLLFNLIFVTLIKILYENTLHYFKKYQSFSL